MGKKRGKDRERKGGKELGKEEERKETMVEKEKWHRKSNRKEWKGERNSE